VLPLSHDAGIIEFITDAITIDELRKKGASLRLLLNSRQKQKNFLESLVGYSLVTYFLQVKDRHNGNIMVKSDGSLLHIDYGFFMTNMPGKGVELEKHLPFKLTTEYVEALGGLDSKSFQDFRLLFYKAFSACRKHQHRIIILTKLMYSSFGTTMPCFSKGAESYEKLEERFNPPGLSNDAEISNYCQELINSSVDNWRSRWYDKWQYYMQGILY
jgi:phosphatidylinositol 4-kinase B